MQDTSENVMKYSKSQIDSKAKEQSFYSRVGIRAYTIERLQNLKIKNLKTGFM